MKQREDDSPQRVYDDGCLRVEHEHYYIECRGEVIQLGRCEFRLFSRLVRSVNRIVESGELWRNVWGDGKPLNLDSLHVHMYRLRRRFGPFGLRIESLTGVGYRLSTETCCPDGESRVE